MTLRAWCQLICLVSLMQITSVMKNQMAIKLLRNDQLDNRYLILIFEYIKQSQGRPIPTQLLSMLLNAFILLVSILSLSSFECEAIEGIDFNQGPHGLNHNKPRPRLNHPCDRFRRVTTVTRTVTTTPITTILTTTTIRTSIPTTTTATATRTQTTTFTSCTTTKTKATRTIVSTRTSTRTVTATTTRTRCRSQGFRILIYYPSICQVAQTAYLSHRINQSNLFIALDHHTFIDSSLHCRELVHVHPEKKQTRTFQGT